MKKRNKRILWIFILVLVAVVGLGAYQQQKNKNKPSAQVTVETAATRSLTATVSAEGTVEPVTKVKISAEIPGRITKLAVREGDVVKQGDFLVELDPEIYNSTLDAAKSSLKSARANKLKADADYKRISELVTRGMASQADLDGALAAAQLAEADLERAEAQERQARDNLRKTRLSSPMSGTISVLNKEVGELTLGSQFQEDVILVVADLSKMEVKSDVDENDIVSVKVGDTARVEIDALPDMKFRGVVTDIAQSASSVTGTGDFGASVSGTNFTVRVVLIDSVPGVRPGMSSTVDIETDYRVDALSVPIQSVAVRKKGEGEAVTLTRETEELSSRQMQEQVSAGVLDTTKLTKKDELETGVFIFAAGEAQWRPVKTGIAADRYIEILEGLSVGDSVITGPYRALARDMKNKDKVALEEKKKGDKDKKEQG